MDKFISTKKAAVSVRRHADALGMSISELLRRANISHAVYSQWEKGLVAKARRSTLDKIMAVTNAA